jgi:DHA2 family methylenomycin A resistance protein-like MFS transporter
VINNGPARLGAGTNIAAPASPAFALGAALLGFFVVTLDALVVSVALPAMGGDLGTGMTGLQWVADGYTLMFAALLLSAGALADRIGARRAFAIGVGLFVVASVACGLAPTLPVLVIGRLAQGAAAAVLMPASLTLVRHAYEDPRDRARAIALWSLGGAIASAVGPLAGGLATLISWRLIFFINVPVGAVTLLLLLGVRPSIKRPVPFDLAGQISAVAAMAGITYGLIAAGARGFTAPDAFVSLALGNLAAAAFVAVEVRGRHPMVPFGDLGSRQIAIPAAVGFAFTVSYYGLIFLFSLYLQQVRGLSPLETGLAFLPMTVLVAILNPGAARLAGRVGSRASVAAGQFLMAGGLLILFAFAPVAPTLVLALLLIPVGLGGPLSIPPATAMMLNGAPAHLAGTASGVLNTSRQLGGAIAIAVFGALVADRATFVPGLQTSLLLAALVVVGAGLASLTLPSDRTPRRRARHAQERSSRRNGRPTETRRSVRTINTPNRLPRRRPTATSPNGGPNHKETHDARS